MTKVSSYQIRCQRRLRVRVSSEVVQVGRRQLLCSAEMTKETDWPLSTCSNTLTPQTSIKTETIPITIDITMLQALVPHFAQWPPTLDRSMILDVLLFLSLVLIKAGEIPRE